MVSFSPYPADPRPRRAVDTLLDDGMSVDLICLNNGEGAHREVSGKLNILRLPIEHRRGNKFSYLYNYGAFIFLAGSIFALRSIRRRYDLVYVHNMPDILVLSSVVPKVLGAKVLLDLHDPMPELMMTIFGLGAGSGSVRLLQRLEKLSIALSDVVVTVNIACKRIFASRSCRTDKIAVVMNSPDETTFPLRKPELRQSASADRFVIMYHGSLVERNGLDLAVQALDQVRRSVPSGELRIYGRRTAFLDRVMGEAHDKGLGDSVHYFGPKSLEELVPEIAACDVGVIPNHRSAFTEINTPTRIFEYLACGKPVITPRATGICDYFADGSLVFFEIGKANDLAKQIEYVFYNPAEVYEIVKRGQEVYRDHCWSSERQRLRRLVAGLLAEDSSAVVEVATN
jgi:glycosyltransferase involved in cell wall biosynthesis